jgi:hypothetical protein
LFDQTLWPEFKPKISQLYEFNFNELLLHIRQKKNKYKFMSNSIENGDLTPMSGVPNG